MLSKTTIAKFAAHNLVAAGVTHVSRQLIADHTDAETDTVMVKVGTLVAGEAVASQTDVITDSLVEKAAAWYTARKTKKTDK